MKNASLEVKASTAYMICSVLQQAIAIITIPLFTRILTTEEYGISTVYATTMALFIIFTTLQLSYGSFPKAMIKFENDRDGYIASVNGITTLLTVIYLLIYIVCKPIFDRYIGLPAVLMILMAFEMLGQNAVSLWMGKKRFDYEYKPVVKVTIIKIVAVTVISIIAVFVLPNPGVWKVGTAAIVASLIGIVFYAESIKKGHRIYNKEYWKYALSFNIPLIPYYLSQMIFNQSDKLMINAMIDRSAAAKYGVTYSLAIVLTFVINAVNNSFVPWIYRKIKADKAKDINNVMLMLSAVIAGLLLLIIALAPEIILVMSGRKYMEAVYVVPPVAMSLLLLFYAQLFINIEFYYEEKKRLVIASIIAALVNIVLNYFFIKRFGFIAAAYTTLFSYIVFALSNHYSMRKTAEKNSLNPDEVVSIKMLGGLFLVFCACGFVLMALYEYVWVRLVLIVLAVIAVILFKDYWLPVLKQISNKRSNEDN